MGIVHKLKPEVRDFIIEQKKANPSLSCRSLTILVLEKLGVKVSKSSVNSIFQEVGLSLPVGRRPKKKKHKVEALGERIKFVLQLAGPVKAAELAQPVLSQVEEQRRKLEEEELKRREEERITHDEALKLEKEKWATLAEQELKTKQLEAKEEVVHQEDEFAHCAVLPSERECSGAILLNALDYLVGGSKQINEIICKRTGKNPEAAIGLTRAIIFKPLFGNDLNGLWALIGKQYTQDKLDKYLAQVEQIKTIKLDISHIISNVFNEARSVKMHFMNGNIIYLDGQLYTTWFNPYSPYDFSDTVYSLKNYLNKYFFEEHPLVLFTAPGYDMPPKEFFLLLQNFGSISDGPDALVLYGNKLEELENISLSRENKRSLIFGLWPWQYTAYRKVKKIGEFNLVHVDSIGRDLYLADIEVALIQPSLKQSITVKGCALKNSPGEKTRLAILSSNDKFGSLDSLAGVYLSHWPNLEESFQDFSRKIELFTYTGNSQRHFSAEIMETDGILAGYLKSLDAYLRWHFLPAGYEDRDFASTSERFYKLQAKLTCAKNKVMVKLQAQAGYQFIKDLDYLNHRFNERQISLGDNQLIFV